MYIFKEKLYNYSKFSENVFNDLYIVCVFKPTVHRYPYTPRGGAKNSPSL